MDFEAARRTMVATQIRTGAVTDPLVVDALGAVPRELFVPADRKNVAYVDEDLTTDHGRFLLEPLVLARLLQLAEVQHDDTGLVVAADCGYAAAALAQIARSVIALENDRGRADQAASALAAAKVANVRAVAGELVGGWSAAAPYDVVLVAGAVEEIPETLKMQLADGGRLVAVVRNGPTGRGIVVERAGKNFSAREGFDAVSQILPGFKRQVKFVF